MKRQLFTLIILLVSTTLSAKQYPDSVRVASDAEYRIIQGLNIDISGGAGIGQYAFKSLFGNYTAPHTQNTMAYPLWNGAVGINYYFLHWMGLGTGVQLSNYANSTRITEPWTYSAKDAQGDDYTFTATPVGLSEKQEIYMVEIPLTLRFRAIKRDVGFHSALGVKFGIPVKDYYRSSGGTIHNQVYYKDFDLLLDKSITGVLEDITVNAAQQKITDLSKFNCGAYAEIGMLFRVHQRIDLLLAVAGTYYLNDMMKGATANPLGFNDPSLPTDYYPLPFTSAYNGVLSSNEVQQLHPWNVQVKLGLSINAGKTFAQRAYDDPEWAARMTACAAKRDNKTAQETVAPAEPAVDMQKPDADSLEAARVAEETARAEEAARQAEADRIAAEAKAIEAAKAAEAARLAEEQKAKEEAKAKEQAERATIQRDVESLTQTKVSAYKLNSRELSEQSKAELDHAAEVLSRHADWTIEVRGHCCDLGSQSANYKVGKERALEAKKYLVKKGVDASRITVTSMGSSQPLVPNDSPEHREQNRRVEIVINK